MAAGDVRPRFSLNLNEEERGIKERAQAEGTWLKAPNGKQSRLPERAWLQVRTEAFKRWFGDWEKAARKVKIVKTAKDHGFPNFSDARKWAKSEIVGAYYNPEIGKVNVSGAAVDKYLSQKAVDKSKDKDSHLAALRVLPELIENSFVGEVHEDRKGVKNVKDIVRLFGCLDIDGIKNVVKITVKRYNSPNEKTKAYTYEVTEIEPVVGTHGDGKNPLARTTDDSISAAKLLENVEKSNKKGEIILKSSKVVDENGEPLVVYHGGGFGQPNNEYDTYTWDADGAGGWFSPNKDYADLYSYNVESGEELQEPIAAYLNIRNPFEMGNAERLIVEGGKSTPVLSETAQRLGVSEQEILNLIDWREADSNEDAALFTINRTKGFADLIKSKGFDGVHADEFGNDTWMIVEPEQIKSATGNVGTFDPNNPDIRWSLSDGMRESASEEGFGLVADDGGAGALRYSLRTKPAPKKTIPVYKLMRLGDDGKLYPLYIDSASPTELGVWYGMYGRDNGKTRKSGVLFPIFSLFGLK